MSFTAYVIEPCGRRGVRKLERDTGIARVLGGPLTIMPGIERETHGLTAYVHDEGMLLALDKNPLARLLIKRLTPAFAFDVYGPMVIVSGTETPSGGCASLSPAKIAWLEERFGGYKLSTLGYDAARTSDAFKRLISAGVPLCRRARIEDVEAEDEDEAAASDGEITAWKMLAPDSLGEYVGPVHAGFQNSLSIRRLATEPALYEVFTSTLSDGRHVFSVCARVNGDGALVSPGVFNSFALGVRTFVDHGTMAELFIEAVHQVEHAGGPASYWDSMPAASEAAVRVPAAVDGDDADSADTDVDDDDADVAAATAAAGKEAGSPAKRVKH